MSITGFGGSHRFGSVLNTIIVGALFFYGDRKRSFVEGR